ncbi:peptidyl-prolyl cis-trans isomerase E [Cyclospora cayetanensis]|uniref:Peptidyl-prolyl cis-trans isomerase E n=1 Tax=Cyclospora cayetanensis TaxID=88456 RepID=A0A6P6S491_9EIME|nr:peptidyl-prolyl cis-trans isomerase E [Cyclospora cayetanensis]
MEFVQDGDVAMLSRGPNSNSSLFLISFCPLPVLNRQHVVIGTVLKGMRVIRRIEDVGTKNGAPMEPVRIIGCGLYKGPQDGPPFFSSAELLEAAEASALRKEEFLQLSPEKQEELLQGYAKAKGERFKKRGGLSLQPLAIAEQPLEETGSSA